MFSDNCSQSGSCQLKKNPVFKITVQKDQIIGGGEGELERKGDLFLKAPTPAP